MGFPPEDVDTLVPLVRLHLLLPDVATRRDLDDPATAERVAEAVGNRPTLDLLAALVEADGRATGPSAWGPWKAGLVADLVERTGRLLAGEPLAPRTPWITDDVRMIMDTVRANGVPALSVEDPTVTVVAPDHSGLLAEVTGVLALHGLNVRAADIAGEDGVAVEIFTVEPRVGRWPSPARLSDDLAAVMTAASRRGTARRAGADLSNARPPLQTWSRPRSRWTTTPPRSATVVEVRAEDVVGQLHRITQAHRRLWPRCDLGQGLYLRLGGGRRLLRAEPGRREGHRPAEIRRSRALTTRIAETGDGPEEAAEASDRGSGSG